MINQHSSKKISFTQRFLGWMIHLFTASGACIGLLALFATYQNQQIKALWLMGAALAIDAVDGMFARMIKIKQAVPSIDGELLDNIVDFVNYTIVPCFFLLVSDLLPDYWRVICVMAITFSSTYQFSQIDAKTSDHFFKGFPSYWNIAVFYLFFWQMSEITNMIILLLLAVLSFIPIKYVYPSRLDYLTANKFLRVSMIFLTILWGLATAGLLWIYPESNHILVAVSLCYTMLYLAISLYRTWVPLSLLSLAQE